MISFYRRLSRDRSKPLQKHANIINGEGNAILCFPPDCTLFRGLLTQESDDDSSYALYGRESITPGEYKVTIADLETGSQYHLNKVKLKGELRNNGGNTSKSEPINIQRSDGENFVYENSPSHMYNESCPNNFYFNQMTIELDEIMQKQDPTKNIGAAMITKNKIDAENEIIISPDTLLLDSNATEISPTTSSRDSSMSPSSSIISLNPQFSLEYQDQDNLLSFTADKIYKGQKADMMIQKFLAGSKSLVNSKCVVLCGPLKFSINDFLHNTDVIAWSF